MAAARGGIGTSRPQETGEGRQGGLDAGEAPPEEELAAAFAAAAAFVRLRGAPRAVPRPTGAGPAVAASRAEPVPGGGPDPWALAGRLELTLGRRLAPRRPR